MNPRHHPLLSVCVWAYLWPNVIRSKWLVICVKRVELAAHSFHAEYSIVGFCDATTTVDGGRNGQLDFRRGVECYRTDDTTTIRSSPCVWLLLLWQDNKKLPITPFIVLVRHQTCRALKINRKLLSTIVTCNSHTCRMLIVVRRAVRSRRSDYSFMNLWIYLSLEQNKILQGLGLTDDVKYI